MLYVNTIIIITFLIIFIKTNKYDKDQFAGIDKKKHSLYFLYPLASFLLKKTGLEERLISKGGLSEKIRAIHIRDNRENQIKLFCYQKTSFFILSILLFSGFSLVIQIQDNIIKANTFSSQLTRPEDGQGNETIRLSFRMVNKSNKEDYYEDEIIIDNKERIYTDSEWNQILEEIIPYLEEEMLGENLDLDQVDKDLNFINHIPQSSILVEWIPKDYSLISSDGKVNNRDIDEKKETLLTAILVYQDKKVEHTMKLTVLPMEFEGAKLIYKQLVDTIDKRSEGKKKSKNWNLPEQMGDYSITWKMPRSNLSAALLLVGIFVSAILWFFKDRELEDKIKLRNNQMLIDYPEIINKFILLVNAGMTIKQAWTKIAMDYKDSIDNRGGEVRYAYEEMLLTVNELKLGVSEANAYEDFGKRVGLLPFMKFSSMLVQNLKKGNKDMVGMLKQEAIESFGERKEIAKRLGEEASTKLLGPMIIMLVIVVVIIMVPALISFGI